MQPLISIIVPVFNSAPFLDECISSILNQSLTNFEVIFINDGSKDQSLNILNKYALKDIRIKVFNQVNSGVSVARNVGLQHAIGEYIGFVDADDYIAPNYFQGFVYAARADIIGIKPIDGFQNFELNTAYRDSRDLVFEHMLTKDSFNSVCFKIFNTSIIKQYDIQFPIGMKLGEDAHFIMRFMKHAESFTFINDNKGYFYRDNLESATKSDIKDNSIFERVFLEYTFDHEAKYGIKLSADKIISAKLQKLIDTYVAALSIYFRFSKFLLKENRIKLIKQSLHEIGYAYQQHPNHYIWNINRGRFNNEIVSAIIKKQFWKLRLLFAYSHWRNGIK